MEEKLKRKASPKKKKSKKSSPKSRSSRLPMLPELNDNTLPYNLSGPKIFALQEQFAEEVKNNTGRTFEAGNVVKGKKYKYIVVSALGPRTYIVQSSDSRGPLIMKTEAPLLPPEGPIIRRELLFLSYAKKRSRNVHRTHFMNFVDVAEPASSFAAVFMNKADFSLAEVRQKQLNGAEFSPQTAVRLCLETLQAIHDVHRNAYVHRDIQPKNFLIGGRRSSKSTIFITGFSYAYDMKLQDVKAGLPSVKELAKLPEMSAHFQSRNYHRFLATTDPIFDLESWIFMCYSFFNSKSLPWAQVQKLSEREYLNQKEAFFSGTYDAMFEKLGLPPQLIGIRNYFLRIGPKEQINYPVFAHSLMLIAADLKIDWLALYEWQKPMKTSKKSVVDSEESNDVPESAYLPTKDGDDQTPLEQQAPVAPARKRQVKKYDSSVEETQDQSSDVPIVKEVVKKPTAVKAPKVVTKPVGKIEETQEGDSDEDESTNDSSGEPQTPIKANAAAGKSKQGNAQKTSPNVKPASK